MEFIDFVLGTLLAFGCYKGLKNGLFVELASLVSFIAGIYFAIKFSYIASDFLAKNVHWSPKTVQVTAFILTLLLVVIAIHLLAKVFTGIASFAFLGWANALAGSFFGLLKTALFIGIMLSLFQKVNVNNMILSKETQENAILFNPCIKTSEFLLPVLTDWFEDLKAKAIADETSENEASEKND
ncbi:CvpA family protein [Flavobacterium humi]|uniref:CvpA family protein n=1 Tax=Flavobacterium humi TaxID=2562683 RepID=A0A4Z0L933_9FLAO|nr:CvpA family protein [Flavobacterium humi]TGD58529.1 CvpA family protein [Flavobacterium humi]